MGRDRPRRHRCHAPLRRRQLDPLGTRQPMEHLAGMQARIEDRPGLRRGPLGLLALAAAITDLEDRVVQLGERKLGRGRRDLESADALVVAGIGRLVGVDRGRPWKCGIVDQKAALDLGHAGRPQAHCQAQEIGQIERRIAAPLEHQIALQPTMVELGRAQQLGAVAMVRAQQVERDQRGDQLGGRSRDQRQIGIELGTGLAIGQVEHQIADLGAGPVPRRRRAGCRRGRRQLGPERRLGLASRGCWHDLARPGREPQLALGWQRRRPGRRRAAAGSASTKQDQAAKQQHRQAGQSTHHARLPHSVYGRCSRKFPKVWLTPPFTMPRPDCCRPPAPAAQ